MAVVYLGQPTSNGNDGGNMTGIYEPPILWARRQAANRPNGRPLTFRKQPSSAAVPGKLFLLELGGRTKLVFRPDIYPTQQIKTLGFTGGKTPDGIFIWHKDASIADVTPVLAMFPGAAVSNAVAAWREEEQQKALAAVKAEQQTAATVETDAQAFDYQKEAITFLAARNRAMCALAPGLGKTFVSLKASAYASYKNVLVVAPLSLLRNWRNEIRRWLPQAESEIWHKDIGRLHTTPGIQFFYVTNYDTVVRKLAGFQGKAWDLIILDETVLIKNRKAKRTRAIAELTHKTSAAVWLLSGAPCTKFYDDMWAQLNALDPKQFSSYWRFVNKYTMTLTDQWGTKIIGNKLDAADRIKEDLKDTYFARAQDDVLNLPDWLFENIEIEMGDVQAAMYHEMEEEFLATLPDGDEVLAPNVLVQMLRLVQIASNPALLRVEEGTSVDALESAKWDAVSDLLEFNTLPAIVWTAFKKTARLMAERLSAKYRVMVLTGDTPIDERQNIVDRFQGGELDVIVAHPGVGKFGLTLTAGRTCIYLERGYNGDDYYQSLHRVRRIGTTHSPHIIHLMSVNGGRTVDHVIDAVLRYRRQNNMNITSKMVRAAFKGELEPEATSASV